jgi:iron complex transport system substrate-binding protein
MMKLRVLFALLILAGLGPGLSQSPTQAQEASPACVTDYDPQTDYFPDKMEVTQAQNFSLRYENNYKVLTVEDAFDGAPAFSYVLIQCGTPPPATETFPAGTQFIEVPTGRVVALSTTQLPHLVALGMPDSLIGVDSFTYINTPEVLAKIEAGELIEVGFGAEVNLEAILEAEADLVMAYGFNPDTDAHPKLLEVGIPTALSADWREQTPLGRAEWLKFTAAFLNAEAAANAAFEQIVADYTALAALTADLPAEDRPLVLWNSYDSFGGAWSIPGQQTYVGVLLSDAGGQMAVAEDNAATFAPYSFEVVYDQALGADVWLANGFGVVTLDDLLAQDARYADFAAFQAGAVWNYDLDQNANGGNNYFELGATRPDLVLADLLAIFYPDLMPGHEFSFFRRME